MGQGDIGLACDPNKEDGRGVGSRLAGLHWKGGTAKSTVYYLWELVNPSYSKPDRYMHAGLPSPEALLDFVKDTK